MSTEQLHILAGIASGGAMFFVFSLAYVLLQLSKEDSNATKAS